MKRGLLKKNGETYMAINIIMPSSFTCSGCGDSCNATDMQLPDIEFTQEDITRMFNGEHETYLLLCDDCMEMYDKLMCSTETLH